MSFRRPDTDRPAGGDDGYDVAFELPHADLAEFSLFARAGTVIVDARGEIDLSNATELTRAVEDAAAQGSVILDLTSVTFIDSTGVRELFRLRRRLSEDGTSFRVVVPMGAPIRRVLTLLDVPSAVAVDDCLDDALLRLQVAGGAPRGDGHV